MDYNKKLSDILSLAIQKKASDIYISSGRPIALRINGILGPIKSNDALEPEIAKSIILRFLN